MSESRISPTRPRLNSTSAATASLTGLLSACCRRCERANLTAPMPDNLRAWLMPIAKKRGPIVSRILMRALRGTWKRAGLYPWPQDAHRHSFISYRRRLIGDAQTALDAGTSETIIKRHYKRPVTKDDAERYFAIRPAVDAESCKILAFGR